MGEAGSMEPVDLWIDSGTLGIRGEVDHGAICTSQLQIEHKLTNLRTPSIRIEARRYQMGHARGRALGRRPVGVQIGWPKGSGSVGTELQRVVAPAGVGWRSPRGRGAQAVTSATAARCL
jgi:hypothetical protein